MRRAFISAVLAAPLLLSNAARADPGDVTMACSVSDVRRYLNDGGDVSVAQPVGDRVFYFTIFDGVSGSEIGFSSAFPDNGGARFEGMIVPAVTTPERIAAFYLNDGTDSLLFFEFDVRTRAWRMTSKAAEAEVHYISVSHGICGEGAPN